MTPIEKAAEFSVARGCGFALLAILVFMVGLSGDMRQSLAAGGVLALLAAMVLLLKAAASKNRPYGTTELWILLKPQERPHEAVAQQVVSRVLSATYVRFALHFAVGASALLVLSFAVDLARKVAGPIQ